jgi:hypothetical protein
LAEQLGAELEVVMEDELVLEMGQLDSGLEEGLGCEWVHKWVLLLGEVLVIVSEYGLVQRLVVR